MKKTLRNLFGTALLAGTLISGSGCAELERNINAADGVNFLLNAAANSNRTLTWEQRQALRNGARIAGNVSQRIHEDRMYNGYNTTSTTTSIKHYPHTFITRDGSRRPERGYTWMNDRAGDFRVIKQGEIEKVWVDHNEMKGNQMGMIIHTKFQTRKLQNSLVQVAAYFYDGNGNALRDRDNQYDAPDGQVAVSTNNLNPTYEYSTFNDTTMFMPYDQLDIWQKGSHNLRFKVQLWDKSGQPFTLDTDCCYGFTYTNR